jgi:hypothetical protein
MQRLTVNLHCGSFALACLRKAAAASKFNVRAAASGQAFMTAKDFLGVRARVQNSTLGSKLAGAATLTTPRQLHGVKFLFENQRLTVIPDMLAALSLQTAQSWPT